MRQDTRGQVDKDVMVNGRQNSIEELTSNSLVTLHFEKSCCHPFPTLSISPVTPLGRRGTAFTTAITTVINLRQDNLTEPIHLQTSFELISFIHLDWLPSSRPKSIT